MSEPWLMTMETGPHHRQVVIKFSSYPMEADYERSTNNNGIKIW